MKKLLPLLLCSVFSVAAFGQIEWVLDNPFGHEDLLDFKRTKTGEFVFVYGDGFADGHITVLDSNGVLKYHSGVSSVSGLVIQQYTSIVDMPDGSVAATVYGFHLDTLSGLAGDFSAVIKLDDDGNLSDYSISWWQFTDKAVALSDGSFAVLDKNAARLLSRVTGNETILWGYNLFDYNALDLAVTSSDTLLLATMEGLLKIDKDGNIIAEYPGFVFDKIKVDPQDNIFGSRGDSLFMLSPGCSLLGTVVFQGDGIDDFSFRGDSLTILTSADHLHLYNYALLPLDSFQLSNDGGFDYVDIGPERLALAGGEHYGGPAAENTTRTVFLKEYSFAGDDFGTSNDVGVTGVVQSPETTVQQQSPTSYRVIFKDVKITVKNFGAHPVESLYLRAQQFRSKKFTGLSLQPGEEVELVWEELAQFFSTDPAGQVIDLCTWPSHPDTLMDLDASNDTGCADFLVADEETPTPIRFSLSPNPVSHLLNVQVLAPAVPKSSQFRIVDATGRLMTEREAGLATGFYAFPVSGWAAGVYFLQYLEGGEVRATEQFVKQ